jgi:hypothetical protein
MLGVVNLKHESLPHGVAAGLPWLYAAFFCSALTFAHLALCAAAILFLPAADMVRLAGAELVVFRADIDCERPRTFAHRACCASAILRRAAEDTIRVGRPDVRDTPVPFKDSIPEITWSNFSISICARLRFSRSS